jgi:hypothetical protein
MRRERQGSVAFCVAAGLVFFEGQLQAYVDPGSGALLWQILVGGFLGAMYLVRKVIMKLANRKMSSPK